MLNDILRISSTGQVDWEEEGASYDLDGTPVLAPVLETEIQDYMRTAKTSTPGLHLDLMVCPESRRSQEELGRDYLHCLAYLSFDLFIHG
jgi:hypothetical protein